MPGRDPSESPDKYAPYNKSGMWKCSNCEEWNDGGMEVCPVCYECLYEDDQPAEEPNE